MSPQTFPVGVKLIDQMVRVWGGTRHWPPFELVSWPDSAWFCSDICRMQLKPTWYILTLWFFYHTLIFFNAHFISTSRVTLQNISDLLMCECIFEQIIYRNVRSNIKQSETDQHQETGQDRNRWKTKRKQ